MATLETGRLFLTPIREDDLEGLASMWADAEVVRYLPTGEPRTDEGTRREMKFMLTHWKKYAFGAWVVRLKEDNSYLGICGLQYLHAEPGGVSEETAANTREVELFYSFARPSWGKGIGKEAAKVVVEFGFQELVLPRLVAAIHPDNFASRRILEGLGFREDPGLAYYGDCPHFQLERSQYLQAARLDN